jgi:SulP family sulfate permease
MPLFDKGVWLSLLPTALVISFVGYIQSLSVAKSLGSKRREKIDANQELVALGVANFGAVLTGGYPVTGGFSRSFVNFTAGASSGLASIFTALLIAFTLLFLTPLFYFLPKAVLGAIILVAVAGLIDTQIWRHLWDYNKPDAISLIITFLAILAIGIEKGILLGMLTSIILYIWCTSRPQVAIVGQLGNSKLYCNALRYKVQTWPCVVAVRVDGNLYFANAKYLEDSLLRIINENARVKNMVLVGTGINFIDASALETLKGLKHELHQIGIELHLADFKIQVMARLQAIGFVESFGKDHIYFSTYHAMKALGCTNQSEST